MTIFDYPELYTLINSLTDGIFITDDQGTILLINDAAAQMEKIDPNQYIGRHITELSRTGILKEEEITTVEVMKTKKIASKYKDNHNGKKIMTTGIPIFTGDKLTMILVQERDITAITNLQQELDYIIQQKKVVEEKLSLLAEFHGVSSPIVYRSRKVEQILQMCLKIAALDTTVLISGESGTGKGVLADFIHEHSGRDNYVKIDCTAIPPNLFESELFGYEKGSFTGADIHGKIGKIELANNGTLFIDEIGELPMNLQAKLLTAIQEKKIYRIGGNKHISVNFRIIAATNKDLEDMVQKKLFREDLFFRLNVIPINMPPLRDRTEDIYYLANHFLNKFNEKYHSSKTFSPKTIDYFIRYDWPGNIRELENTIERLVIITEKETITAEDLPIAISQLQTSITPLIHNYATAFADFEKKLLTDVMNTCTSTKQMSSILGIASNTITTKLKRYGIKIPYKKGPKRKYD